MPKKQRRYSLAVQRSAVEQALQGRPIAQVARQLQCSDQSVQRWISLHRESLSASSPATTFLPIRVDGQHPSSKIELVTRNGLTLRFPIDTPSNTLIDVVRNLEGVAC